MEKEDYEGTQGRPFFWAKHIHTFKYMPVAVSGKQGQGFVFLPGFIISIKTICWEKSDMQGM